MPAASLLRALALCGALAGVAATWHYFPDSNGVPGCGDSCSSHGTYTCLGNTATEGACVALCAANATCHLMTWSQGTRNCWTRDTVTWDATSSPGDTAGCDDDFVADCGAPAPPANVTAVAVQIDTGTTLGTTDPLSPAVALDFWRSDDPRFGVKWGNSSALNLDLTHPRLRALVSALAPGLLRLGGSPEDSLLYGSPEDGTCFPQSGGNGTAPGGYYCSQVHPYSYDCLSPQRWSDLLAFASATGMKIALGLNGALRRRRRRGGGGALPPTAM